MQLLRRDAGAASYRRTTTGALSRPAPGPRQKWFRVAAREVDRAGTLIEPGGIDLTYHRQNPVVLWQHQSGTDEIGQAPPPDVVIGRAVAYERHPDYLDVLVEFDDDGPGGLANRVWAKVQKDLIRMVSLQGQICRKENRQIGGREIPVITELELYEVSLVIVGSLRSALRQERAARAAAARTRVAGQTQTRITRSAMDKGEFCKAVGIGEDASREAAEDGVLNYLTDTGDDAEKRKAVRQALDEHFPEKKPDDAPGDGKGGAGGADPPAADPKKDDDAEKVALREALRLAQGRVAELQAELAKVPAQTAEVVKREAQLAADVDGWQAQGRIPAGATAKAEWLERHRAGKAQAVVNLIQRGTYSSGQRLHGGVGTPVELPAEPKTGPAADAERITARVETELTNARVSALPRG